MTTTVPMGADETLRRGGKSFWFASLFLPKQIATDAAVLYQFCRTVDDLADHASPESPLGRLESIRHDLQRGSSHDPLLVGILRLHQDRGLSLSAAESLVDALLLDATGRTLILDEAGLLRYAYAVAGTVGLMMSAILGVKTSVASVQAIDLGIAMQLTNIARDVAEDAAMGRRYLPGTWVHDLSPGHIASASTHSTHERAMLVAAVERVLVLADVFYANAAMGFQAIPASARNGIRIAASIYREIGTELRRRGCDPTGGRATVAMWRKIRIALTVYAGQPRLEGLPSAGSLQDLHLPLKGLPGIG